MRRCLLFRLVLPGCLGAALFFPSAAGAAEPPAAPKGRTSLVIERCWIKLVDQVMLASDRPGVIGRLTATEGTAVARDEQVVRLLDDVTRARLARAEKEVGNDIEIRYARKAADVARIEFDKALLANQRVPGAIPDIEINRLRLARERSVLQIEQAEHTFELNRLARDEAAAELNTFQIAAPFDGIVTNVYKRTGEAVVQGEPILELTSTRRIRIEGYVNVADAWRVQAGDRVEARLDIPDVDLDVERETFGGRIVFVDVTVEKVSRKVRVWAEVENRDDILRAGLNATMVVHLTPKQPPRRGE
jgi:membrane fusion protein, multidrug efflux system